MQYTVLCLNPARDVVLKADRLKPGGKNIAERQKEFVSGKGTNVATFISGRITKKYGPDADPVEKDGVTLITFANDQEKEELKTRIGENVCLAAVPRKDGMRRCYKIITGGEMTEINETGPRVTDDELKSFITLFAEDVSTEKKQCVLMCGSIPHGVEKDVYFYFIKLLNECGTYSVLDSSGKALYYGLKAGPTLIKPNITELYGIYLDEAVENREDNILSEKEFSTGGFAVEFAKKLQWKYGCRVLCTLGEKGSFYVNGEYVFYADCPQVEVENLAGAGDCYLSGFVFDGGLDDVDPEKTVSAMRSAGANAAAYISGREDIETFLKNITVNYQRYFFGEGKNE